MTSYIVTNRPEFLRIKRADYIFFPFWSWKIPVEITSQFKCIGFHTGNLPEQAGGSPIQNLIRLGEKKSYVNAILLNDQIDGGEVIMRKEVSLEGDLEEILIRISGIIAEMMDEIQKNHR